MVLFNYAVIGDTTGFVRINTRVTITEVSTRFNLIPWYCFNYAVLAATICFSFFTTFWNGCLQKRAQILSWLCGTTGQLNYCKAIPLMPCCLSMLLQPC